MNPSSMPWPCGTQRLRVDDLDIDLRYRRLSTPEQEAELPRRIFDLFLLFLAEPHQLHCRSELFARVWPGVIVEDANLSHSIWLLRRALGGARKHWIRTVAKSGYVFEPPARIEIAAAATALCVNGAGKTVPVGAAAAAEVVRKPVSSAARPRSHWRVAVAAVLLALALLLWWQRLSPLQEAAASSDGHGGLCGQLRCR